MSIVVTLKAKMIDDRVFILLSFLCLHVYSAVCAVCGMLIGIMGSANIERQEPTDVAAHDPC